MARPKLSGPEDSRHGTPTGYAYGCRCDSCKIAQKDYQQAYRSQNREQYATAASNYYHSNKEAVAERAKKRYDANLDEERAKNRSYYASNRDRKQEQSRQYLKENRARINTRRKERRTENHEYVLVQEELNRAKNRDQIRAQTAKTISSYRARNLEQVELDRKRLRPNDCKQCRKCREWLDFESFSKSMATPDGLASECKSCRKLQKRKYAIQYWHEKGIDPNVCYLCQEPMKHMDHVVPLAKGGPDEPWNLMPSCFWHNQNKKAKEPEAYFVSLIRNSDEITKRKALAALQHYRTDIAPKMHAVSFPK